MHRRLRGNLPPALSPGEFSPSPARSTIGSVHDAPPAIPPALVVHPHGNRGLGVLGWATDRQCDWGRPFHLPCRICCRLRGHRGGRKASRGTVADNVGVFWLHFRVRRNHCRMRRWLSGLQQIGSRFGWASNAAVYPTRWRAPLTPLADSWLTFVFGRRQPSFSPRLQLLGPPEQPAPDVLADGLEALVAHLLAVGEPARSGQVVAVVMIAGRRHGDRTDGCGWQARADLARGRGRIPPMRRPRFQFRLAVRPE